MATNSLISGGQQEVLCCIFFLTGVSTINLKVKIYFEISTNFYSQIDEFSN
jgi:hypothetical protein